MTQSVFTLPEHLSAKADPTLIARDEQHFAAIEASLAQQLSELQTRLETLRRLPGGAGQAALDRDLEIHRLSARQRLLQRYGADLCLGRMVGADTPESGIREPVYIGRLGLIDEEGRQLLMDWRAPAAEPFFAATHAEPMGLVSRRRYRWTRGRITDYWDEVFSPEALEGHAALDDQSAFIASLGSSRSPRMRDVLSTIQADQDAIIRADSHGALVVDGGPGTGKTVVALHRAAYLLFADSRLSRGGGVLFVGPHQAYLAYVADVLPSLGEESVQICTLRDLAPEGAAAADESDADVAALKAGAGLSRAVDAAVSLYETPPAKGLLVETDWADVRLTAGEWADAFDAAEPGAPHNEAREQVWEELLSILVEKIGEQVPAESFRRLLEQHEGLTRAFDRAWPLLDPVALVATLWSNPAFLQRCAPWLSADEAALLQRDEPRAWTTADLPILDAARHRIGDPGASSRRRQHRAAVEAERERMARVVDDLIAADDDGEGLVTMLRGEDVQHTLVDEAVPLTGDPDRLAGPFAHIIVDEAQELGDEEWRMLLRRCPSRSFTIVGDRAQARQGFPESWQDRLQRIGLNHVALASLSINYRTPSEVMAVAEPVIRAVLPDANVPTSIRSSGLPVAYGTAAELDTILDAWLAANPEGTACVIGDPSFTGRERVRSLSPVTAKGLEFDLVVLVDPESFGAGTEGAVDRYVAMTRATRELVVLSPA